MKTYSALIAIFLFQVMSAQTQLGILNETIQEPSGLAIIYDSDNGHFDYWANNDTNYPEMIHSFRPNDFGSLMRSIDVGVPYVDWEDMTQDDEGNIYLADFGNWVQDEDLQVVKIPNPSNYNGDAPSAEVIEYAYPTPTVNDSEGIVHLNGYLYMFTKRVADGLNDNFTYCYRIPDTPAAPGEVHVAEAMGSFSVINPGDDEFRTRITGAALSPDKSTLALLTYSGIWLFTCLYGDDFFNANIVKVPMIYAQFEGIVFANNHEVFMTKEGNDEDPDNFPKLFHLNISDYIDEPCMDCEMIHNGDFENESFGWKKFEYSGAQADYAVTNGAVQVAVNTLGTSNWHVNVRQKGLIIENGKTYTLRYKAFALQEKPISIILNHQMGTGDDYLYATQTLTTSPTYYEHEFTMDEVSDFYSILSFNFGKDIATTVFFDDISLKEVECEINDRLTVDLKVMLQGPYNADLGIMDDIIRVNEEIPNLEPYTALGFNHIGGGGGEATTYAHLHVVGSNSFVDWVFVELRSANDPTNVIATQAALVRRDGQIVSPNGGSVSFEGVTENPVYVSIRHRNHFGIRTANAYPTSSPISLDFTNPALNLFGTDPMTLIDGKHLMIAGDANGDGQINTIDKNGYWQLQNGQPFSYQNFLADYDLNGIVNSIDRNLYWRVNNSAVEQLD